VLRPPSFGAQLTSVDASAAEAVTGAKVVREGDFVGVVAPDPLSAARAVQAIEVEWEEETNPPSNADLEAHLRTHPVQEEGWQGSLDRSQGDPRRAFAAAARTFAATYATAYLAHLPLEARAAVADIDADGRLTVWTGTQRPFPVREEIAAALDMAEEDIRVIVSPTGSGYGGKHTGEAAVEAARMARATGRPVKVRWTRSEEFQWAYLRPAAVIDIRSAVDAEGRLVGWEHVNINSGPNAIETPYDVDNVHLVYQAAASPLRQGSWRALAATANNFARESHIDEIAHALGADPLEFRLRHISDERLVSVLEAAEERADRPPSRRAADSTDACRGTGICCGVEKDGRVATWAEVQVDGDDQVRVERLVTAYDAGLVVDRDNLVNQIEGAAVMGLSAALFEGIRFGGGRVLNDAFSGYRVARFSDTPEIEVVVLDRPDQPSVGAGETPIICVAPAIANAIFAATGDRRRSLPLLRDR
jgi:nicotinate dehydrogenase subunit B